MKNPTDTSYPATLIRQVSGYSTLRSEGLQILRLVRLHQGLMVDPSYVCLQPGCCWEESRVNRNLQGVLALRNLSKVAVPLLQNPGIYYDNEHSSNHQGGS